MKDGWVIRPLGDLCSIRPPKSEAKVRLKDSDLVSFLPMEDLDIDNKHPVPRATRTLMDVEGSYTYFADGDVLLAKITPCFENGKLGIASGLTNGCGFGSSEFFVIRPTAILDTEYLYYFLSRASFRVEGATSMGGAVGHQRVTKEFIESYPVPVPPLPEQQRIVAILDEAFEGLALATANAEKNLKNAQDLFAGYLNSTFERVDRNWVKKRLSELGRIQTGNTPKTSESGNLGTHIPFIKPGDFIPDGSLNYDNEGLSQLGLTNSRLISSGSALMVCIGATIGKAGFTERDIAANQQINAISPHPGVSGKFLYYYMTSSEFQSSVMSRSAQATLPIINKSKWSELEVALPTSFDEQQHIASSLDQLGSESRALGRVQTKKLAVLDELKQSLLAKAFAGDLT